MAPNKKSQQHSQKQTNRRRTSQEQAHSSRQSSERATPPTDTNLDEFVNRCVRYMLIKGGSNATINEADIKKVVLNRPSAPKLKPVMKKASKILAEVYGFKVQNSVNTKTQYYFVHSILPPVRLNKPTVPEDSNRIMLMLILVHVYMCDDSCTEESLQSFLQRLQFDSSVRHPIFGNCGEFIKNLVKQKYLDAVTHHDKVKYKWGVRAECTFSKVEMLEFVAKIIERNPQTWAKGEQAAKEQKQMLHEDSESDTSVESF